MVDQDEHWMHEALKLARQAEQAGEVPVGAVVVSDGIMLGAGFNQPIQACDPTAHAEIQAIRAAAQATVNYRLPGCTLYVTLEPCTMCLGALVHSRIETLVFAAREPRFGAVVSQRQLLDEPGAFNHQVQWREGVSAAESSALLQAFFRRRRQAGARDPAGSA